jgi:hypothetical protein
MYDNLSLIYESSLRPNIIRQDVLESCVLLIRENKNTQVQYYVENILTFAELQYLTEAGFLGKLGQGAKNLVKKAAPYAAAGLLAAGGAKAETPIHQQMDALKKIGDRFGQVAGNVNDFSGNKQNNIQLMTPSLINQIKSVKDKVEKKSRDILLQIPRTSPNLENQQIQNITDIQNVHVELLSIEEFLQNENELRREEKKPDLTVSVNNLNEILNGLTTGVKYSDNINDTVNKITSLVKSLKQEVLNIKGQLQQ